MGSAMELLQSATTHKVKQAEIDAKRTVQGAYNEREAATTSLARYAQSVSNQRKMDAAGKALNAQATNIQNALDAAVVGTFAQRIQAANELGAAAAQAASAGVGGGSVEAYRMTLRLNQAIQEEAQSSALNADVINAKDAMGDTIRNAVADLNNDDYAGNFDYTIYLDHVKQKNVVGAAIAIGVASYFGGPQAGMATSDAIASGNRYANNDREGGNALVGSAIQNGFAAYQNYNKMNSGGSSGSKGFGGQGGGSGVTPKSGFWSTSSSGANFKL